MLSRITYICIYLGYKAQPIDRRDVTPIHWQMVQTKTVYAKGCFNNS